MSEDEVFSAASYNSIAFAAAKRLFLPKLRLISQAQVNFAHDIRYRILLRLGSSR